MDSNQQKNTCICPPPVSADFIKQRSQRRTAESTQSAPGPALRGPRNRTNQPPKNLIWLMAGGGSAGLVSVPKLPTPLSADPSEPALGRGASSPAPGAEGGERGLLSNGKEEWPAALVTKALDWDVGGLAL